MIRFDAFEVLTFDCYGTLIDWDTGITEALKPIFIRHHVDIPAERALDLYAEIESELESGEYHDYRTILRLALTEIGRRLDFKPSTGGLEAFAESVKSWPPFADSPHALQLLKTKYKLAIISNIDDDLIAETVKLLNVNFDWIITAQQVRSYKPSHRNFEYAHKSIGIPSNKILHVAQSLYHDIIPTKEMGIANVWVNRRYGKTGFSPTPSDAAQPDLEVQSLEALASRMGLA